MKTKKELEGMTSDGLYTEGQRMRAELLLKTYAKAMEGDTMAMAAFFMAELSEQFAVWMDHQAPDPTSPAMLRAALGQLRKESE